MKKNNPENAPSTSLLFKQVELDENGESKPYIFIKRNKIGKANSLRREADELEESLNFIAKDKCRHYYQRVHNQSMVGCPE